MTGTDMPGQGNVLGAAPAGARSNEAQGTINAPERAEANQQSLDQIGSGERAASGHNNQAITTTNANAQQPAKGANSFTKAQAKTRLENDGFRSVNDLTKDNDGIWRGRAQKNGSVANVWVDYRGNVGETKPGEATAGR